MNPTLAASTLKSTISDVEKFPPEILAVRDSCCPIIASNSASIASELSKLSFSIWVIKLFKRVVRLAVSDAIEANSEVS